MTGAEASERDAKQRDKIAAQELQLQALNVSLLPPTSSSAREWIRRPAPPLEALEEAVEAEEALEEVGRVEEALEEVRRAEEALEEAGRAEEAAFQPPPSTAPAALTASRAGRKRAPTMKALEAEKAPKRGMDAGKGKGPGRDGRRAKG